MGKKGGDGMVSSELQNYGDTDGSYVIFPTILKDLQLEKEDKKCLKESQSHQAIRKRRKHHQTTTHPTKTT